MFFRLPLVAVSAVSVLLVGLVTAPLLRAGDTGGNFALKGAALKSCADFTTAWDGKSPDIALYGGWIEGYLTALNQFREATFDLAPWQTTETLLGMTRSVCDQSGPETQFMAAFWIVVRSLQPERLDAGSEATALTQGGQTVVLYAAVAGRIDARLSVLGYETGATSGFTPQTAQALMQFQADRGLPPTGLPDQKTLFELFRQVSQK